mmetsp:Transcript_57609/g.178902  ORF Transcript_57609/g.178902 Transcript_57609/m.178902 type:complete len:319 (+) Transcript_57609:310-1266(+)
MELEAAPLQHGVGGDLQAHGRGDAPSEGEHADNEAQDHGRGEVEEHAHQGDEHDDHAVAELERRPAHEAGDTPHEGPRADQQHQADDGRHGDMRHERGQQHRADEEPSGRDEAREASAGARADGEQRLAEERATALHTKDPRKNVAQRLAEALAPDGPARVRDGVNDHERDQALHQADDRHAHAGRDGRAPEVPAPPAHLERREVPWRQVVETAGEGPGAGHPVQGPRREPGAHQAAKHDGARQGRKGRRQEPADPGKPRAHQRGQHRHDRREQHALQHGALQERRLRPGAPELVDLLEHHHNRQAVDKAQQHGVRHQ